MLIVIIKKRDVKIWKTKDVNARCNNINILRSEWRLRSLKANEEAFSPEFLCLFFKKKNCNVVSLHWFEFRPILPDCKWKWVCWLDQFKNVTRMYSAVPKLAIFICQMNKLLFVLLCIFSGLDASIYHSIIVLCWLLSATILEMSSSIFNIWH